MNYFLEYLPVRSKDFRASPLHELWQNKMFGQAGFGYGTLTVLKQEDRMSKYGFFEVTGFHRFSQCFIFFYM